MKQVGFVLFLILASLSCSKRSEPPTRPQVERVFGSRLSDTPVKFLESYRPLRQEKITSEIYLPSSQWLGLSKQLLETGHLIENERLLAMGSRIFNSFYSWNGSTTKMSASTNPPGNPYVELAYPYAQKALDDYKVAVIKVKEVAINAAEKTQVNQAGLTAQSSPALIVTSIINGIDDFLKHLEIQKTSQTEFGINKITKLVRELPDMKGLLYLRDNSVYDKDKDKNDLQKNYYPVKEFMRGLLTNLELLQSLDAEMKNALLLDLSFGIDLAEKTESIQNENDALIVVVDLWQNKYRRLRFTQQLKNLFESYNDSELLALITNNQLMSNSEYNILTRRDDYKFMTPIQQATLMLENKQGVDKERWEDLEQIKTQWLIKLITQSHIKTFARRFNSELKVDSAPEVELNALIASWMGLEMRLLYPYAIRKSLTDQSPEDLELVKNPKLSKFWHPFVYESRQNALNEIKLFVAGAVEPDPALGISRLKAYFGESLVKTAQLRVVNALLPVGRELKLHLRKKIVDMVKPDSRTAEQIYLEQVNKNAPLWFFKDGKDLPLLEKSGLQFSYKSGKFEYLRSTSQSGAKVLGVSLAATTLELDSLQEKDNALPIAFQMICKLASLMGYKHLNGEKAPALTILFSNQYSTNGFDISSYNPQDGVFATPEFFSINERSELIKDINTNSYASVGSQMELLSGYNHVLKYLKPWEKTTFDKQLGKLKLRDESGEELAFDVFDKDSLFAMTIGLSNVILQNIKHQMARILTSDDKLLSVAELNRLTANNIQSNEIAAVLVDLDNTKKITLVKTSAIAQSLIALAEFYQVTSDSEKSQNKEFRTKILPHLVAARSDIKRLITGLTAFSLSKLMMQDGGFSQGYNFQKNTSIVGVRNLDDQLLMEEALLSVGQLFNSDLIRFRAVDNLFFINKTFWNSELGFYNMTEDIKQSPVVKLASVSKALKNAHEFNILFSKFMTHSSNARAARTQLEKMERLWLDRFFDRRIQELPAISQVFEFSL
ncbi:MAG: hypothetical protein SGI74_12350 [Oligoflexia bacterium]|nr:hypothetical protein [Oligoflexia bacterium]